MADIKNDIDLVDRFLRGELSAAEEHRFHERRQNDADFDELYQQQQLVMEGIADASRREIKARLQALDEELQDESRKTVSSANSYWGFSKSIAAGLALLIIGLSVYYLFSLNNTNNQLYNEYFSPPAALDSPNIRGESTVTKATNFYNEGDYSNAEDNFEQALDQQFQYTLLYHLAITKMRLEKLKEAESLFMQILAGQNSYHPDARWYLALIYLKWDEPDKATPYLEELVSSNSEYSEQASNILNKL